MMTIHLRVVNDTCTICGASVRANDGTECGGRRLVAGRLVSGFFPPAQRADVLAHPWPHGIIGLLGSGHAAPRATNDRRQTCSFTPKRARPSSSRDWLRDLVGPRRIR